MRYRFDGSPVGCRAMVPGEQSHKTRQSIARSYQAQIHGGVECFAVLKITLSREDAAAALSVNVQTIDRMIKAKELRASKLRRRVVVRVADIERLLDAHAA